MAPTNVTATVNNSTAIIVRWNGLTPCMQVNGLIVKYRVECTSESSGMTQSRLHSGAWNIMDAETLLTGLFPFTNYSIQVAAVNEQGDVGLYSDPEREQTKEDSECFRSLFCVFHPPHYTCSSRISDYHIISFIF